SSLVWPQWTEQNAGHLRGHPAFGLSSIDDGDVAVVAAVVVRNDTIVNARDQHNPDGLLRTCHDLDDCRLDPLLTIVRLPQPVDCAWSGSDEKKRTCWADCG